MLDELSRSRAAPIRRGIDDCAPVEGRSGALLLALVTLGVCYGQAETMNAAMMQFFQAHVPYSVLADLKRRLLATKWTDELPGTAWEYGADVSKVRELADYWPKTYDWRVQEAGINQFDQFTTEIDGQTIHFIHERSPRADAIPIMLIHGWPSSFLEFLAMIEPLTNPKDNKAPAFDVIVLRFQALAFLDQPQVEAGVCREWPERSSC
jgi:Epoxide hydrolase N terminus